MFNNLTRAVARELSKRGRTEDPEEIKDVMIGMWGGYGDVVRAGLVDSIAVVGVDDGDTRLYFDLAVYVGHVFGDIHVVACGRVVVLCRENEAIVARCEKLVREFVDCEEPERKEELAEMLGMVSKC